MGGIELLTIPNSKGELPGVTAEQANNLATYNSLIALYEKAKEGKSIEEIIEEVEQPVKPTLLVSSSRCNMHRAL